MEIRSEIKALIGTSPATENPSESQELVNVSPATKKAAFAYERFRNTLEPDEEEILRRKSISRILERRLKDSHSSMIIAEQLLQELIRANYIEPVKRNYVNILARILHRTQEIRKGLDPKIDEWFLNIVAVAIDHKLFPQGQEEALVRTMYQDTFHRVEWVGNFIPEKDQAVQLYIACYRSLFEADDYEIAFHYFTHRFSVWEEEEVSKNDIENIAHELPGFYQLVQGYINYPSRDRIMKILRPVAVPYRILREITQDNSQIFESENALAEGTKEAIANKTKNIRSRMNKRAWHSILFLFFTKTILAGILEVPYELLVVKEIHKMSLIVNVTFHPLLLFLLATSARLPGSANSEKIVEQVKTIITGELALPTIIMQQPRRYGAWTWTFFALIYVVLFLFMFWGLFGILGLLGFSLVAMLMFVVFLGLVSFLAIRVRKSSDKLRVLPRNDGVMSTLFSFLSLPVLEFGRWLATHIAKINIPLIFMDRILEAPFKIMIDVIEEWFEFVKDRREEIV